MEHVAGRRTKKRGRPPLPKGEARDQVLKIRVTVAEKIAMEAEAVAVGITLSEFIRKRLRLDELAGD